MNINQHSFRHDISWKAFRRCLLGMCLLGLIIRTAFCIEHAHDPSFGYPTLDQRYYDMVARMLLNGKDLHELHGFRPLLYPIFLAGIYNLGGAWGVELAIFIQHFMGVATGLLVVLLGLQLTGHRLGACLGGMLYLLAPIPLYFEGELLIASSYTFLIVLALPVHLWAATCRRPLRAALLWFLGGCMIGLAAQARANIVIFLAIYPVHTLWKICRTRHLSSGLLPLLGIAGTLAMALPWASFNMCQSDHFHLLPNQGGVVLYVGNKRNADGIIPRQDVPVVYGANYQDSIELWARLEYEAAMRRKGLTPDTDPMAVSSYWTARALDEIEAAPAAWVRLMLKKCWLALWNEEVPNNKSFAFLRERSIWLRVLPVRWVVLLVLTPLGIWACRNRNPDALGILVLYGFFYMGANIVFLICDRYRYPVYPAMAALAGHGAVYLAHVLATRRYREALILILIVAALACISLCNLFGASLPSYSRDYLFRSLACADRGLFDEALDDIDSSLALDPLDFNAHHHRGDILLQLDRREEALSAYSHALKLSPSNAHIWNNLGVALDRMQRQGEAEQAFRKAMACEPSSRNAFLSLTMLMIRTARHEQAVQVLRQCNSRFPEPDHVTLILESVLARHYGHTARADALEHTARSIDCDAVNWVLEQLQSRPGTAGVPPAFLR